MEIMLTILLDKNKNCCMLNISNRELSQQHKGKTMGKYSDANTIKVGNADLNKLYLRGGVHTLEVVEIKEGVTQKGEDIYSQVFKVLSTNSDELSTGEKVDGAFFDGPSWRHEKFIKDIKKFLGACVGENPDSINDTQIERTLGDALSGTVVKAEVIPPNPDGRGGKVVFRAVV